MTPWLLTHLQLSNGYNGSNQYPKDPFSYRFQSLPLSGCLCAPRPAFGQGLVDADADAEAGMRLQVDQRVRQRLHQVSHSRLERFYNQQSNCKVCFD